MKRLDSRNGWEVLPYEQICFPFSARQFTVSILQNGTQSKRSKTECLFRDLCASFEFIGRANITNQSTPLGIQTLMRGKANCSLTVSLMLMKTALYAKTLPPFHLFIAIIKRRTGEANPELRDGRTTI